MKLKSIKLENFRNYSQVEHQFHKDIVVISGDNGVGKTNLLEAVYYLSNLRSFRSPDNLLVKTQEDYFKIGGQAEENFLETGFQIRPSIKRSYLRDGIKIKKLDWKTYRTVLFVPEDLNLFIQGPSLRRKYLNEAVLAIDRVYGADLVNLDHILKQRSSLLLQILERTAKREDLEYWNQRLAEVSLRIFFKRGAFISFLNLNFSEKYQVITTFTSRFEIKYFGISVNSPVEFLEKLKSYEDAEIRTGQNLYGPHRDDFEVIKDSVLNIHNSSSGELRSQVVALKLLQAEYISQHGPKPIMLLDDVYSELDRKRKEALTASLKDYQIFITTFDKEKFFPNQEFQSIEL